MAPLSRRLTCRPAGGAAPYLLGPSGQASGEDSSDPLPQRPVEPDATDCCGEGCACCVFDVYEEALERYEAALAAWHGRHP